MAATQTARPAGRQHRGTRKVHEGSESYVRSVDTSLEGGPRPGPTLEPGRVAPPGRRRGHTWLVALRRVVVAALVLALLALGDWGLRVREMSQLVSAVEDSERSMIATNTAFGEMFLRWQAQPTITPTPTTAAALAEGGHNTLDSLRKYAAVGKSRMMAHGGDLYGIPIAPWHHSLRAARDDYLAHVDAWHDHYAALSADFSVHVQPQPQIDSTFGSAGLSLRRAVPAPDPLGFGERVEQVLAD